MKRLRKLDRAKFDQIMKTIQKFAHNPHLPGLRLEKLAGHENLWTIRVDLSIRIAMSREGVNLDGPWILHDFGPHDKYREWDR